MSVRFVWWAMVEAWTEAKYCHGKVVYSSFVIVQLCPVTSLSSVLPFGLPSSPTVVVAVLMANALVLVCRTWP